MASIHEAVAYEAPGQEGDPVALKSRYENFIGGDWRAPASGEYSENLTPATGEPFTEVPRSTAPDIEFALDAAHAAKDACGEASTTERSPVLSRVADAIEENIEMLAVAESWENGKSVRETLAADIPLAVVHFRYFASVIRGEEGAISEIDKHTVAYHFKEPLGVVGQIITCNFPLLMAAWKVAPALAAGNAVVLKPARPTPWSILTLAGLLESARRVMTPDCAYGKCGVVVGVRPVEADEHARRRLVKRDVEHEPVLAGAEELLDRFDSLATGAG